MPIESEDSPVAPKTKSRTNSKHGGQLEQRLFKALAHPLRFQALIILSERVASPNELSKELGEGLSQVSYHVKVLLDADCIELVKTEPRRGAVEHYYRATSRAFLSDDEWAQLPDSVRPGFSVSLLQTLMDDAVAALKAGTFDSRDDHHLSRTQVKLDEQGWQDVATTLSGALDRVLDIQAESVKRMAKSGEEAIPATVAMMSFEASPSKKKKSAKPQSA
jgi:DNA-binding transcriptional ArsR family regulator